MGLRIQVSGSDEELCLVLPWREDWTVETLMSSIRDRVEIPLNARLSMLQTAQGCSFCTTDLGDDIIRPNEEIILNVFVPDSTILVRKRRTTESHRRDRQRRRKEHDNEQDVRNPRKRQKTEQRVKKSRKRSLKKKDKAMFVRRNLGRDTHPKFHAVDHDETQRVRLAYAI